MTIVTTIQIEIVYQKNIKMDVKETQPKSKPKCETIRTEASVKTGVIEISVNSISHMIIIDCYF